MRFVTKIVIVLALVAMISGCAAGGRRAGTGPGDVTSYRATAFNDHCQDPKRVEQLRRLGPLYAIGASVSHGLLGASFPVWIRDQMCLSSSEYEDDYFYLFFLKSNRRILKHLSELRPKLIVAMDFPYHYVKLRYAVDAKPILRKYLGMLLMDCESELIVCGDNGPFHFVRTEDHHPIVLAGSIYFDCRQFLDVREVDGGFPNVEVCQEENDKLNAYMHELAEEYPNLYVFPAYEMVAALHHTKEGVYRYDVNGVQADFKKGDLFFDGFHPWTDPGSYVLANIVINWINEHVAFDESLNAPKIPYIPLQLNN